MIAKIVFSLSLLLLASSLPAQSDLSLDIRPNQLLTGDADETLQELGARAAASGATLVVTAPSYWHELIGEQILVGAGDTELSIEFKDTVIEAAWVRSRESQRAARAQSLAAAAAIPADTEPEQAAPAAVAPPPEVDVSEREVVDTARPVPTAIDLQADTAALAEQARLDALSSMRDELTASALLATPDLPDEALEDEAPEDEALADEALAEETQAPVLSAPATQSEEDSQLAALTPSSAAPVEPVSASPGEFGELPSDDSVAEQSPVQDEEAAVAEPVLDIAAYREDLQDRVNFGRPIRREINLDGVRAGDELFSSGPVLAVVRRSKAGINVFWLTEAVDLDRPEISEIQNGRYLVEARLTEEVVSQPPSDPTAGMDERGRMELRYNFGRNIRDSVDSNRLREDDMIYVGDTTAVVIRRGQVRANAYWLSGDLDLSDERIRKEGSNKYRVLRDFR